VLRLEEVERPDLAGSLVTIASAPPERAAGERGVRAEAVRMSPNAGRLAEIADLVAAGQVHAEIAARSRSRRCRRPTGSSSRDTRAARSLCR